MNDTQAKHLLHERIKRFGKFDESPRRIEGITRPYIEDLFPEQRSFIEDVGKRKTARTSRRAGKSHSLGAWLIEGAETIEDARCLYITLTRPTAKRIMWTKLLWFKRKYSLDFEPNHSELICKFPGTNGQIVLAGASDQSEIDKFRGDYWNRVAIDESQAFGPYLQELVEEVLDPTLLDTDGDIALSGTPNAACVGYFHDITNGVLQGWANHRWTVLNNTKIPNAKEWVEKRLAAKGWTWDHPVVQREWLGLWVRSLDSMVYRFMEGRNTAEKAPEKLQIILGIDLGYNDATAFSVIGFEEHSPDVYVLETYKRSGMLVHDVAHKTRELITKWDPLVVKADTGGLGKMIVEEMITRYDLPIAPADKKNKNEFIETMNADFEQGHIKILLANKELISQYKTLQWDEDRRKEDSRYPNDLTDATLYAWREAKGWAYVPRETIPTIDQVVEEVWKRKEREIIQRRNGDFDL